MLITSVPPLGRIRSDHSGEWTSLLSFSMSKNIMKYQFLFPTRAMRQARLSWQEAVESFRVMKSLLTRLALSLTDRLTKEHCIAIHLFWKGVKRIGNKSGWLMAALYIKQARVCLQKYAAHDDRPVLNVFVSLTGSGIPRIIPSFHRRRIHDRDPLIIKLYMSLFTVSRLIALAPRIRKSVFQTITDPPISIESIQGVAAEMRPYLRDLLSRYCPGIDTIPLNQGLRFVPTWKSVPSIAWAKKLYGGCADASGARYTKSVTDRMSAFLTYPYELASFQFLMNYVHAKGEQFSQGCLWPPYTRYAFDPFNKTITPWSLDWFERRIGPLIPSCDDLGVPPNTGRLCQTLAGDGKRRLFAIGNYFNQRLLAPVHQWLASVLKRIPMDGTFNQTRPLDRLRGVRGPVHSVDLKAATDRWPLLLLFELVQALFDRSFASSVVNSTLACNTFDVTFTKSRTSVCFVTGQPLGYLSSWPLFALSHHVIIWWAAEQVYPGRVFRNYAVLGDDVVIADDRVKASYESLLARLGVGISVAKSLSSPSGGCEFAKKFRLNRMTVDVSPVSIKALMETNTPIGWYNFVRTLGGNTRLSTLLRLGRVGYKAASRPLSSGKHGRKVKRLLAMLVHQRSQEYGIWLALSVVIGSWVRPEVVGRIIFRLLEHFQPKDPVLPPEDLYPYPGMAAFQEYAMYRGWMEQYLKYLKWYSLLYTQPELTLDAFLDVPVYVRTWYRPVVDLESYRFGVIFCMYDWASQMQVDDIKLLSVSCIKPESQCRDFVLVNHQE